MSTAMNPTASHADTDRSDESDLAHTGACCSQKVNVSESERMLSLGGGSLLALFGLHEGSASGLALALAGGALIYRGLSGHCHLYDALDVSTAKPRGAATSVPSHRGQKSVHTVIIRRAPSVLYRFWRDFENLPKVMRHLESVKSVGENRWRWTAKTALGMSISWDAEIINDRENELIAWRSLDGSDVDSAGSVHFLPTSGGRATQLQVSLKYDLPAGAVGAAIGGGLGIAPEQEIEEDLQQLKQLMESGQRATRRRSPGASRR